MRTTTRQQGLLAAAVMALGAAPLASADDEKTTGSKSSQTGKAGSSAEAPPVMDAARASELARTALADISAANTALDSKDTKRAQTALDTAATNLRQLYTAVPAGELLSDLGPNEPGKPLNLAPVLTEVRSRSVWMDPEVTAQVEEAERDLKKGDQEAAREKLLLARQRLAADVALLPIEGAYARVQAARGELREGNAEQAQRLLRNVPMTIAHLQTTTPLVPVRFNLRAAATAAEHGEWDRTKELVGQATRGLEQLAATPAPDQFEKQLKPIVDRAKKLQGRLDKGQKPAPRQMRDLAKQTRSLAEAL